jgi:hypothetical protein
VPKNGRYAKALAIVSSSAKGLFRSAREQEVDRRRYCLDGCIPPPRSMHFWVLDQIWTLAFIRKGNGVSDTKQSPIGSLAI